MSDSILKWEGNKVFVEVDRVFAKKEKEYADSIARKTKLNLYKSVKEKTGAAGRSIQVKKSKYSGYIVVAGEKRGTEDAYYFKFIELGAPEIGLSAHHPMLRAYKSEKKRFISDAKKELKRIAL